MHVCYIVVVTTIVLLTIYEEIDGIETFISLDSWIIIG